MGFTNCKRDELESFIKDGKAMWNQESYDLFDNNCNHFTNWLCNFLLNKSIPAHILELPEKVKKTEFFKIFMKQQIKKNFRDIN
jgi:hypothetical protein